MSSWSERPSPREYVARWSLAVAGSRSLDVEAMLNGVYDGIEIMMGWDGISFRWDWIV